MLSVGEIFKKTREKRGIDLETVEKEIRVRKKHLKALEHNDWSVFSSKIYISGIIKNYSRFLGLSNKKMLAFFRRDYERREDMKFKKRIETKAFKPQTRSIIISAVIVIFLLFALYFSYQLRLFLTPPSVEIVSPQEITFRSVERITVIGETESDATVIIFDDVVIQNKDGTFEYDLPMEKGENTFKVTVRGANGKETSVTETFVLE